MKKSMTVGIVALAPCLAYAVVVALTERVFWNTVPPIGKERRAALAIRDNVSPFQKWGSKQFTLPYLDKYYDAAWYFTQTHSRVLAWFARVPSPGVVHYPLSLQEL